MPDTPSNTPPSALDKLFSEAPGEKSFPTAAVAIAAVVLVVLIAAVVLLGHRSKATPGTAADQQVAAAYGPNLQFSSITMSEAASLSGGKSTYIDGHVANRGDKTVTGVTLQLEFPNDEGKPAQVKTVPLTLIRMREPYIDIGPVSGAPLAPGAEADFRLILEDVATNWNLHEPGIHATQILTR